MLRNFGVNPCNITNVNNIIFIKFGSVLAFLLEEREGGTKRSIFVAFFPEFTQTVTQ
jgi:hypothetical protein